MRPEGAWVLGGRSSSTRISGPSIATLRTSRTYVLSLPDAGRVSRGALQGRPEPCERDALRVVAQSLYGLRAPLHLLLRPRIRAARRPALRRSVRDVDPREGQH